MDLVERPRRNRRSDALRRMVREHHLRPDDFIWPMFVVEGKDREQIASMPGIDRLSIPHAVQAARHAHELGIPAVALFPALDDTKKDRLAKESMNKDGLLQRTVRALKDAVPDLLVITDVAMDPYSSDGHDGIVEDGIVLNDETLEVLAGMAVSQAEAGADLVAPSDMMDGRVGAIRDALDESGLSDVGILAYSAKYASAFYGPFREALDSAPRHGDKKTYQMDPANVREAIREVLLDEEEGADIVMVKPGLAYLDVIRAVREVTELPLAAYNVSGEYAMVKAAAANGWIDGDAVMAEILLGFKRAGADVILSYAAVEVAERIG
jgi:porphobilinogen synthase